jgi:hypothetical protein
MQNLNPELLHRQVRIRENPQEENFCLFECRQGGRSFVFTEEDWCLASGGMCQRNDCRLRTLGGTVDFVARQLANGLTNYTAGDCARGYWLSAVG